MQGKNTFVNVKKQNENEDVLCRGDHKLTKDEQPVLAHLENWLGISCMSALEFIYTQTNELA